LGVTSIFGGVESNNDSTSLTCMRERLVACDLPNLLGPSYHFFPMDNVITEKSTYPPLNYHSIDNIPSKLSIVIMSPLKLPNNCQCPPKGQQKDKNDPTNFSIRQKYPYKFEKKKIFFLNEKYYIYIF
jgi:hypothetical protein